MIAKITLEPVLTTRWVGGELDELRTILDRAMNTLEPVHTPQWLKVLSAECDAALGQTRRTPPRKEYVTIPIAYARAAVSSLRFHAHDQAAHSQAPDIIESRFTYEHEAAEAIESAVKAAVLLKV